MAEPHASSQQPGATVCTHSGHWAISQPVVIYATDGSGRYDLHSARVCRMCGHVEFCSATGRAPAVAGSVAPVATGPTVERSRRGESDAAHNAKAAAEP